ncbi:hypothetical protein [Nocardioides rubriscoriae]|uniref:hypothetical protein n=1 Tax=Nocardioides rubriscoriae TaxID=642762 RepID=UPI0011DF1BF1|nr:hypothetical protein [Nocardioides rubriscoriae]
MNIRHLRLVAGPVLALGLVLAGTAVSPAQAARGAGGGTDWLSGQLDEGLLYNDQYGFNDYGLTADAAIALDAVGGHARQEAAIRKALARNVDSWTTGADFGSSDQYAGSTAKAVVLAQAVGAAPRSFGGVDLVARLNGLIGTEGPARGRIRDAAEVDYANTIGQAFAVQGLSQARSGKADDALSFLLKQQCSAGFFRLSFAPATQRRQSCDDGSAALSTPDTDATALALLSLDDLATKGPRVRAAINDAARWLKRTQKDNGSFGGGASTESSNTNSTGLAAWALGETGSCAAAGRAAQWVLRLQKRNGAIAYDRAGFASGRDGIQKTERDQFRRATAQAAPGLRYLDRRACSNG